jgi:hypothetical protein
MDDLMEEDVTGATWRGVMKALCHGDTGSAIVSTIIGPPGRWHNDARTFGVIDRTFSNFRDAGTIA